jgi:hypothetical protein
MALSFLYGALFPLRPCILSMTLCFLNRPARSTTLCLLYSPLFPLSPSVPSITLCPLYGPLSPLRPSVSSTALCLLCGPPNSKGCRDLIRISDDRDDRDNHDYHSSEKSCDNRDKHIHQEAIIVFREKLKTPFRINPTQRFFYNVYSHKRKKIQCRYESPTEETREEHGYLVVK